MRCYVVGDIHGCVEEVVCLLDALPLQPMDKLVFLGDYVDRGPDSRGVVSYLIQARNKGPQETIFIKGNHEEMLLSYLGLPGKYGDMFLVNGGDATMASYGISRSNCAPSDLLSAMPADHLEFFKGLKTTRRCNNIPNIVGFGP